MKHEEPPLKKRKKALIKPNLNLQLPNDLLFNCLARVSRFHYPTLSLVSKRFESLLSSPDIYQTRLLLDRTETCLYVCLRFPPDPNPHWFTLCRKPNQTLTKVTRKKKMKKVSSDDNVLSPVPVVHSPSMEWSNLISAGPYIYVICDPIPSSSAKFLDCWSHTWREAPGIRLINPRRVPQGRMYLAGVFQHPCVWKYIEVFDTKTQNWKPAPQEKRIIKTGKIQGKIYPYIDSKKVAFNLNNRTREIVGMDMEKDGVRFSYCMIDNVLYQYKSTGEFHWRCKNLQGWRRLQGLKQLPKFAGHSIVKLVDYGGKMAVFWTKYVLSSDKKNKMIWCAEISLQRRKADQIWGKVVWLHGVLTVPATYEFMNVVAVDL